MAIALTVVAFAMLALSIWSNIGESEAAATSTDRIYICSQTGKSFHYQIKPGEVVPVLSPHSGQKTGFPAELCYWTKDGQPKDEPTAVLLNVLVGKPGPTFCPECKRLVVGHNPPAAPGRTPPPTQDAYVEARKVSSK